MSKSAMLLLLLAHCEDLVALKGWPPVSNLIETVLAYSRDAEGGITDDDCRRLRQWSRRWMRLSARTRTFYAKHASEPGFSSALWCVLEHYPRPPGRSYGLLVQAWEADFGYRPQIDLCPQIP